MSGFALTRRSLLSGSAAAAVAPLLPSAAPAVIGIDPAQGPSLHGITMWAVGSPGEFDWRPIAAETIEEAFRLRFGENHAGNGWIDHISEFAQRVPDWDGRPAETIMPADWIDAGMGACCFRCDGECYGGNDGYAVGADVVCEDCMEIIDWVEIDESLAIEQIAAIIADSSENEARDLIDASDAIPPEVWAKAVAEASEAMNAARQFKGKS